MREMKPEAVREIFHCEVEVKEAHVSWDLRSTWELREVGGRGAMGMFQSEGAASAKAQGGMHLTRYRGITKASTW